MKSIVVSAMVLILMSCSPKVEWISTTESQPWVTNERLPVKKSTAAGDVMIDISQTGQTIEGFGACFNELGWTSLSRLKDEERQRIFAELFKPGAGANFTICRMPVGANDISPDKGGFSRWGWQQNSLVTVDPESNTFQFNHEYYLLKHVSHFVKPGARRLITNGAFQNILAFINPDKSIACIVQNDQLTDKEVKIEINGKIIKPVLPANSFNTFLLKAD